jgi:uncharacterized protein
MLLDLSEIIIREGMRSDVDVDQPGVEDPDLVFQKPLQGRLSFVNGGDLINIHGNLETTLTLACSRCLMDVGVPLQVEVEEHFPVEDIRNPNRKPEEDEDYDPTVSSVVYLDQGRPILDLDELMRQLLVMELPIRTLCDEACKGICQQCGANRNETACACDEQPTNTPLAGLGALLKENGG